MASRDLLVFENGRTKRRVSSSETLDFLSVKVGSTGLEMKETAGAFDFSAKEMSDIANATADTSAPGWGQVKSYVAAQVVAGGTIKQQLLSQQQLSDALGIIPGTVVYISVNPVADETITLKDAANNTETWTFKASRSGANEVTIGANAAATTSNLTAAIMLDSAFWKSYYDVSQLDSIYPNGLAGIYRNSVTTPAFKVWTSGGTIAGFVADYHTTLEYKSDATIIALPTAEPGTAVSGIFTAKASLSNGEIHNCIAEDKLRSWNADFNNGAGEWFTMSEGVIPVATSGSGGSTLGKATFDSDKGVEITGIGVVKAKIDNSTTAFDGTGNIIVKAAGITETQLAASVAGAGLAGGAGTALSVNVDGSTIEVTTDTLNVKAAGITETQLAASVAGAGLAGGAGTALSVNVDGSTLEITTDTLNIKAAGVTETQLAASVAGAGLAGGAGTALSVNVDGSTLEITTDTLNVKAAGITETQIAASVAGAGLAGGAGTALSVNVDGSTIEITTDTLNVKAAGITETQLAASVAGAGLAGGAGTALSVNVDGSTLEITTDTLNIKAGGVTATQLNASVAGDGLAGGGGTALSVNVGDGMQILSDAVAADYTKAFTNDNAGAITTGQVVYVKANGNVDLAQANIADLNDFELGIVKAATVATTASGAITVRRGAIRGGYTGLTPGKACYVSRTTAGAVTQSLTGFVAGEFVFSVGRAISATEILFSPNFILEY
jgi:hypothetical protein